MTQISSSAQRSTFDFSHTPGSDGETRGNQAEATRGEVGADKG